MCRSHFGMLKRIAQKAKSSLTKRLLARQLQHLPERERNLIFQLIERHPDLFEKIATEAKAKMDSGVDQFTAMASVMQKYRTELTQAVQAVATSEEGHRSTKS